MVASLEGCRSLADEHIELGLDGLEAGVLNFTLVASDWIGTVTTDSVLLVVNEADAALPPPDGFADIPFAEILLISGVGFSVLLVMALVYLKRRK